MTPVYQIVSRDPAPVLDLDFVKAQLQIETADLDPDAVSTIDDAVEEALAQAVSYVESQTHLYLSPVVLGLEFCAWPCFPLMVDQVGPVSSVDSIRYLDENAAEQTFSQGLWGWQKLGKFGSVYTIGGPSFPALQSRPNAVTIEVVAGYERAGATGSGDDPRLAMPALTRKAVLLLTGHFYEHRDAVQEQRSYEVELGADNLLAANRLFL